MNRRTNYYTKQGVECIEARMIHDGIEIVCRTLLDGKKTPWRMEYTYLRAGSINNILGRKIYERTEDRDALQLIWEFSGSGGPVTAASSAFNQYLAPECEVSELLEKTK